MGLRLKAPRGGIPPAWDLRHSSSTDRMRPNCNRECNLLVHMLITATEHPEDDIWTAVWRLGTARSLAKLVHKISHHTLWRTLVFLVSLNIRSLSEPGAPNELGSLSLGQGSRVRASSGRWSTATLLGVETSVPQAQWGPPRLNQGLLWPLGTQPHQEAVTAYGPGPGG